MNFIITLALLIAQSLQLSPTGYIEIKLGIFLPITNLDLIHAAYVRVAQFNNISNLIHPQARLSITYSNATTTRQKPGINAQFGFVRQNMAAVLGAGISSRSAVLSKVLQNGKIPQWYNLLTSDCASSSPTLSNKTDYPNFFRTIPNDEYQGKAIIQFIKSKNWKKISILCTLINR